MGKMRNLLVYCGLKLDALLARVSPGGRMRVAAVLLLVLLFGWGGAIWATHVIDDNPDFTGDAASTPKGEASGSQAVAVAAALIARETDTHAWTSNEPFFKPGWFLDNMPNFQQGIIYALSRFTVLMGDQLGRSRGSSQIDPDLDQAAGLLKYPGDVWIFNFKASLLPTASSEAQYRAARRALLSYNRRLAEGKAVFDPRADNLIAALDSIAADLGSQSAAIEHYIEQRRFWLTETESDDIFYATKGRAYAYYLLLKAMEQDFAAVIRERDLTGVWRNMLRSLRETIGLQPLVVMGAAPDSMLLPNHLAAQGFYLLRARTNLREISAVLAK